MTTVSELMRVLQFGDSMLPVGSFSFSNGLESAVQQRRGARPGEPCASSCERPSGRRGLPTASPCSKPSGACDSVTAAAVDRADRAVFNRKLNEEMRTMTVRMGRKLAELAEQVLPMPRVEAWLRPSGAGRPRAPTLSAQALVFAALELSEQDAFAVHQYGVASMMLGAALAADEAQLSRRAGRPVRDQSRGRGGLPARRRRVARRHGRVCAP